MLPRFPWAAGLKKLMEKLRVPDRDRDHVIAHLILHPKAMRAATPTVLKTRPATQSEITKGGERNVLHPDHERTKSEHPPGMSKSAPLRTRSTFLTKVRVIFI
jgi:hypothetical protein